MKRLIKQPIDKQLKLKRWRCIGSGVTAPCIRNLGTTLRRNFSFILLAKGAWYQPIEWEASGTLAPAWTLFKISQWDLQRPSLLCTLGGKLRLVAQTEISVPKPVTVLTELSTSSMHMPKLMPLFPRRPYLQSHSHSRYQHHNFTMRRHRRI
jgi:hypothetical protein